MLIMGIPTFMRGSSYLPNGNIVTSVWHGHGAGHGKLWQSIGGKSILPIMKWYGVGMTAAGCLRPITSLYWITWIPNGHTMKKKESWLRHLFYTPNKALASPKSPGSKRSCFTRVGQFTVPKPLRDVPNIHANKRWGNNLAAMYKGYMFFNLRPGWGLPQWRLSVLGYQ